MAKKRRTSRLKQNRYWLWFGAGLGIGTLIMVWTVLLNSDKDGKTTSLASEVSVQEAAALRDDGAFVLDVREPDEWANSHIPGATLIPLGELQDRLSEVPHDQKILVVCRTGHRSAQGRDMLQAAGYKQVTSLTGGLTEWIAQGYPTETGS